MGIVLTEIVHSLRNILNESPIDEYLGFCNILHIES